MHPLWIAAAVGLIVALLLGRRRVSRVTAVTLVVAAAVLAVYGSGAFPIPDVEREIRAVGPRLGAWTYVLVGSLAFLESGALVGLVAPGEFAVIFGGFVAGQGQIDPFVLGGLVTVAATTGDLTSYALGRRLGRPFLERHGRQLGLSSARLARLERFYAKHGGKTIVLGRFIGFARALSPFLAGASRLSLRRFLAFDPAAALVWTATFVALGYIFWESFDRAVSLARNGSLALLLLVGLLLAGMTINGIARSPERRRNLRRRFHRPA